MKLKHLIIAGCFLAFSSAASAAAAQASCHWDGFVFPHNWEIKLDGHVHVPQPGPISHLVSMDIEPYEPPAPGEDEIVFRTHREVEAFVKETVEEGLSRVARLSPCLLNDRLQRFGSQKVILTSEIDSEKVGYQFAKKGNFLGRGKKEAKIFLGGSHPYANIAKFKYNILHGVFHHLQMNNDSFSTHQERDAFINENFVFQDFRGFMNVLKNDTAHACLQVAYPNMMFEELQGAEFMDACMTCINSYYHDGYVLNSVVIGREMPEHRQKCQDLRPEYLDRNDFHPTEESTRLLEINEREEWRRRNEERGENIRKRMRDRWEEIDRERNERNGD